MLLVRTYFMTVLVLQCLQILNAEYLSKGKKKLNHGKNKRGSNKRATYYNPWTPTYLTVVRLSTNNHFPQPQPQNSHVIHIQTQETFPLSFRPKIIYYNAGYPVDNPPKNSYSPKQNTTSVSTLNRFGDDEDGPVWDTIMGVTTPSSQFTPTRRNNIQGQVITFPPVIRQEMTTARSAAMKNSLFRINSDLGESKSVASDNKNPSRCVWAIISCCSTATTISYQCFEQLGCVGAFWDSSPCESDFARAAIANIMSYYQPK